MPRIKSEIFEQYAQIAEAQGLVKLAEDSPELKKYKDDVEARVGSDSIDVIEALYGVKPDAIDGMEYEQNIIESAHPKSVVIAPSYDKLNGLVENEIERHNIITNIVLKPNHGNLVNPKYAHQELVLELVRIANEMDNKNKEELFKLADECLIGIQKKAFSFDDVGQWFKEKFRDVGAVGEGGLAGAGIGALVGGLITVWTGPGVLAGVQLGAATGAAIGSILAAFTKTAPQVKNVELNAQEVSKQLQDLRKKTPEHNAFFDQIDRAINNLIASSAEYHKVLNSVKEHNLNDANINADHQAVVSVAEKFTKDITAIKEIHTEFSRRVKAGDFAKAQPEKVLKPIYWFVDDDIDDVEDAFDSLEDAIDRLELNVKENVQSASSSNASENKTPTSPSTSMTDENTKLMEHFLGKNPSKEQMELFKHLVGQ